ncbi:MAG: HD domain-containing phosphohydrolase [Acidobacteriota bacterium]
MIAGNAARLLVVDDERYITDILCRWLRAAGYVCEAAGSAEEAWDLFANDRHQLVLTDLKMNGGMSGIDLIDKLKQMEPNVAVIIVTGVNERGTAIRALQRGAYGYLVKPLRENEVVINAASALERRRLQLVNEENQRRLEDEVQKRTAQFHRAEDEVSLHLIAASEYRDQDTGDHIRRMGLYAEAMACRLGWGHRVAEEMRHAAPMHDVGKIGVPDNILLKPARLTPEEFEVVKGHAMIGARILSGSKMPLLRLAEQIALAHHEKWDGSGYPFGLAGDEIPEPARLVTIADVYDALVHNRIYRPALPEAEALDIMNEGRGKHFDPHLLDFFLTMLPEIRGIRLQIAASNGGSNGHW